MKIGTSGWYYRHWIGKFYPPDLPLSQTLAFYTDHFNTVEINNSFYALPSETAVSNWYAKTDIHVYFNNDYQGYAIENASKLKSMLSTRGVI
ncbi:MAG: hypothetical protein C5B54_12445 [Acidobacteria bacterium]|nr:MAG: hypothetical protein C5B54_12445 [Acidobacteriota bacterium]